MQGRQTWTRRNAQETNDFGCWTQENRGSAEGAMGKDQGSQEGKK